MTYHIAISPEGVSFRVEPGHPPLPNGYDRIIAGDYGADSFENSQPLCSPCHYLKTALEHRTRGLKKYLEDRNGTG